MNRKKALSFLTALTLTASLACLPAAAVEGFPDVPADFWGCEYIDKMAKRGYAKGYPDGTFRPNAKMTMAETLLFCSRVTNLDSAVQEKIAAARGDEIADILPTASNMNVWARDEMAVAVETGVLSSAELTALSAPDPKTTVDPDEPVSYLQETVTRENICMYLVRAMQLEPLAKSLTNYTLGYTDASAVSSPLQPYVYVLTNYGIVNGTGGGVFDPKGSVTRAQMTTMLCRALDFTEKEGIRTELSEYTDYAWRSGTIADVLPGAGSSVVLKLKSELSGETSYSLPENAKIYKDNMLATNAALKAGQFVRLNLSEDGSIAEARLSGTLTSFTGTVTSLTGRTLTVKNEDSLSKNFTVDRFTEVQVADAVGDYSLLDDKAGYTAAVCYTDSVNHLAAVRLTGGTYQKSGLIESVTETKDVVTLGVSSYDGVSFRYTIPAGTPVTVDGILAPLNVNQTGKYVALRLTNDTGKVSSVRVDTFTRYLQGPVKKVTPVGFTWELTVQNRFTGEEESFAVRQSAPVTYQGEAKSADQIQSGWYVTALISADRITEVYAYPGSVTEEGTLASVTNTVRGAEAVTSIQVLKADGSYLTYDLNLADLPVILRNGKTCAVTDLLTGDALTLTLRYNKVEKITASPRSADFSGMITKVVSETGVTAIDVMLQNGEEETYQLSGGVTVTQNGERKTLSALAPGQTVELVTNGGDVISVNIKTSAESDRELKGTVYVTPGTDKIMTVLEEGTGNVRKINLKGAELRDLDGEELYLSKAFTAGDSIRAYGKYDKDVFVASIVIKL